MVIIAELNLHNFRGFRKARGLRLAPLTFLVGPNSSGKSTVADSLLFMAQSGFLSLSATRPIWIGSLVDLGSFKDTVNEHSTKKTIKIGIRVDRVPLGWDSSHRPLDTASLDVMVEAHIASAVGAPEGRLRSLSVKHIESGVEAVLERRRGRHESFDVSSGTRKIALDPGMPWSNPGSVLADVIVGDRRRDGRRGLPDLLRESTLDHVAATVQRVSSGRNPPQRSYQWSNTGTKQTRQLIDGVDATTIEIGRVKEIKQRRDALVGGLLALGIADDLSVDRIGEYHTAISLRDNLTGVSSNLADFGYGASQVIPVLDGCASRGPGPLFIEQPEIHLHPRAQGELAQIMCLASLRRQMIIETHSDHLINRARLLVAEGQIRADDVIIQYIDRDSEGSHAISIGIDEGGNFTRDWPGGFYDERFHETMRIVEAQARKAAE